MDRSPSAEPVRSSPMSSPSPSPSHKKGGKKEKKEKTPKEAKEKKSRSHHYVNIFSLSRKQGKEAKSGGSRSPGASPMHNRKRRASDSSQAVHGTGIVRETSPSNIHTPLAQSLNINASFGFGTGNLSDSEGQHY